MLTPLHNRPAPVRLFTVEDSRALDQLAMQKLGLSAMDLIQLAGASAFSLLQQLWPDATSVSVYCGKGNNAADGYILAGLAARQGLQAEILVAESNAPAAEVLPEVLAEARAWALEQGAVEQPVTSSRRAQGDVIVDALLGTGIRGDVRPAYASLIAAINNSGKPVLALDVPSGLNADTGAPCAIAVRADATITFVVAKRGLLTGVALSHTGTLYLEDLGIPTRLYADKPAMEWLRYADLPPLPPRPKHVHKGQLGHALLIGGAPGFGGAAILAAEAALRAGPGLLTVATHPTHVSALLSRCPEAMATACTSKRQLAPCLAAASLVACGPGLGKDEWGVQMLMACLETDLPLILDADALNLLAALDLWPRAAPTLITPHPGEAARLLKTSVQAVEADRYTAARELAALTQAWVLLKGAGTVIASPDSGWLGLCAHGNPGMATGGMGDVLTGLLLGLWAQLPSPLDVLKLGVCVHSLAADQLADRHGQVGLLARDMADEMRSLLNAAAASKK